MNKYLAILAIFSTFLFGATTKHHIGIGTSISEVDTYVFDDEYKNDILLQYGYDITNYLNLGFRTSFQTFNSKELRHNYSYGVYLKPFYKYNDLNLYGVLGYGEHSVSRDRDNFINSLTIQRDFSYGLGFEKKLDDYMYLFVDYVRYINKSTSIGNEKYHIGLNSLSVGLNFKFGFENNCDCKLDKNKNINSIKTKDKPTNIKNKKITKINNRKKDIISQPMENIYIYNNNIIAINTIDKYVKFLKVYKDMDIQLQSYSVPRNMDTEINRLYKVKNIFVQKGISANRIYLIRRNTKNDSTVKSQEEYSVKRNFVSVVYRGKTR